MIDHTTNTCPCQAYLARINSSHLSGVVCHAMEDLTGHAYGSVMPCYDLPMDDCLSAVVASEGYNPAIGRRDTLVLSWDNGDATTPAAPVMIAHSPYSFASTMTMLDPFQSVQLKPTATGY